MDTMFQFFFPKIRCWANFQQIVSFQSVQFCLVCKIPLEKSHLKVDLFKEKQAGQKRLLQYMSMSWMTLRQPELTAKRLGLGSTWLSSWSSHLTRYWPGYHLGDVSSLQDTLPGLNLEPGKVRPPDLDTAVAVLEAHGDQVTIAYYTPYLTLDREELINKIRWN